MYLHGRTLKPSTFGSRDARLFFPKNRPGHGCLFVLAFLRRHLYDTRPTARRPLSSRSKRCNRSINRVNGPIVILVRYSPDLTGRWADASVISHSPDLKAHNTRPHPRHTQPLTSSVKGNERSVEISPLKRTKDAGAKNENHHLIRKILPKKYSLKVKVSRLFVFIIFVMSLTEESRW